MTKPRVFLSSTSDLAEDRMIVREQLAPYAELYAYEEDRPRRMSPADRCREQIRASQLFLCLIDGQYGTPFPDDPRSRSIVEWEFDTAREYRAIEIMTFVRDVPTERIEPRQHAFLLRIQDFVRGLWGGHYTTSDELRRVVLPSFVDWRLSLDSGANQQVRQHTKSLRVLVMTLTVSAAMLLPTVWLAGNFSLPALAFVTLLIVSIILMCLVISVCFF